MQDTGVGIKEEDMKKLFQLFGFLESSQQINTKGIGLGLHITKRIVTKFDGNIICRSKLGEGTNFIFIVALGNGVGSDPDRNQGVHRILNPLKKNYRKIKMDPVLMVPGSNDSNNMGFHLQIIEEEQQNCAQNFQGPMNPGLPSSIKVVD